MVYCWCSDGKCGVSSHCSNPLVAPVSVCLNTNVLTLTCGLYTLTLISTLPHYRLRMTKPKLASYHTGLLTAEHSRLLLPQGLCNAIPLTWFLHLFSNVTFLVKPSLGTQSKIVTRSSALCIPLTYLILLSSQHSRNIPHILLTLLKSSSSAIPKVSDLVASLSTIPTALRTMPST